MNIEKFRKKVFKGIYKYDLIHKNDHILVGLSGGIDSLVMLDILVKLSHIVPFHFTLNAVYVTINEIDIEISIDDLEDFCKNRGVPFNIINTKINQSEKKPKDTCFLCSWNRRKALFQYAHKTNASSIAFGHHQDDIIETLLMNMAFHGEFSTMPPLMKMEKAHYNIIRPLCDVSKQEIINYADLCKIYKIASWCENERTNNRDYFRKLITNMQEKFPMSSKNIFQSMQNINSDYLPKIINKP